ncbi:alpha/beta hydrolase [Streptacidiphilus carbonis]|uniref:alpha/beta hydrolase n=1 Tax=Streptacidiphilus carbonis TaxID=105422 RepID=UPI0005AA2354|nr:alpha/beta hydrolase-fold protein [Streptacidiphilus carbonis]
MRHYEIPPFSQKGDPVSYGLVPAAAAKPGSALGAGRSGDGAGAVSAGTVLPTGPRAAFRVAHTLDDGTHIGVVTLHGKQSGYTGRVWVWAPKAYFDPQYARSGFPVMIALPGGPGYPYNYWMDPSLKLEQSITKWYRAGKSKPFLLAMPVLNPATDAGGLYWDGSDIPGQPKMGTWLTEDVPDLMRANFRTLKSRDGWAFMGSSSGGFASLKAVLKYPDRFKAALISGPDIVPDSPLWHGHAAQERENNPQVLAGRLIARKGPDVYLGFQVGTRENSSTIADVKQFIATYGRGPVHTELNVIQGGKHDAYTYVPGMGHGLIQWISAHLAGPTPSS